MCIINVGLYNCIQIIKGIMEKIFIKNFAGIEELNIELNRINVFIV